MHADPLPHFSFFFPAFFLQVDFLRALARVNAYSSASLLTPLYQVPLAGTAFTAPTAAAIATAVTTTITIANDPVVFNSIIAAGKADAAATAAHDTVAPSRRRDAAAPSCESLGCGPSHAPDS